MNIGSGMGRSLSEVIAARSVVTGATARIEYHAGRAFDVPQLVLSIECARELLGWMPATLFEEGIAAHWKWLNDVM